MSETSVHALIGAPVPVPVKDTAALPMTGPTPRRKSDQHHPSRHHLDRRAADLAAEGASAGAADELLTTSDVAEWLGLSTQWLEIGRGKNYGPRFIVLSTRRIRYRRADVLAWLAERTFVHTAQYRNASADEPRAGRFVRRAPAPTSE